MTMFQWMPKYDVWVYLALAAACVGHFWLARRQARSPVARNGWFVVLRGAVLGILLLVLLNPSQVTETQLPPQPSDLVFLVDCSKSMALDRPVSRLERVKEVIAQSEYRRAADQVRISRFRFGDQMRVAATLEDLRRGRRHAPGQRLGVPPCTLWQPAAGRGGALFRWPQQRGARP